MKPALRKIRPVGQRRPAGQPVACGGSDDDDDAPPSNALKGATLDVAILGTTDLHANVLGYDYYKLAEDKSYGVDRTATLIAEARSRIRTRWFDNGNALKGATLDVAILGTTDLHANVLGYDYYKLAEDKSYGVDRTATLIAEARSRIRTRCCSTTATPSRARPLSDYQALVKPVQCTDMIAIYKQMKLA